MFNLPNLDFLQNPEWQQYIQDLMAGNPGVNPLAGGGGAGTRYTPVPTNSFKVDGSRYTGPFAKQDVTPFRTVSDTPNGRGAGAYGSGLNASAAQLYDHFRRDGGAVDAGLPRAGMTQTIQDFLARRQPTQTTGDTTTPVDPADTQNPSNPVSPPPRGGRQIQRRPAEMPQQLSGSIFFPISQPLPSLTPPPEGSCSN